MYRGSWQVQSMELTVRHNWSNWAQTHARKIYLNSLTYELPLWLSSPSPQPHQNVSSMGTQASPLSGYSLLHAQFLSRSLAQGSEFQICMFNCWLVFIMWAVRLQLGKKQNSGKMSPENLLFILSTVLRENSVFRELTLSSFLQLPHSYLLAPFSSFFPSRHLTATTLLLHLIGSHLQPSSVVPPSHM